jgi:hypothetical protein
MRHESAIVWIAVVLAVMMTCGAAGLYMAQHISIVFVSALYVLWLIVFTNSFNLINVMVCSDLSRYNISYKLHNQSHFLAGFSGL